MPVEPSEFRHALGQLAGAVTVVTAEVAGVRYGITVTSFCSLSLNPPLVLVCIDQRARIHDQLIKGGALAINYLTQDQDDLSRAFSKREPDPFEQAATQVGKLGAPLLADALATIECTIVDCLPGGDHTIVVGQVEATHVRQGQPLLYFRGGYGKLG